VDIFLAAAPTLLGFHDPRIEQAAMARPMFFSYLDDNVRTIQETIRQYSPRLTVCDSGAFAFFSAQGTGGLPKARKAGHLPTGVKDIDEFFRGYLNWIQDNYHLCDYFVELDLQELVGPDLVELWRGLYQSAGVADKIILGFHPRDSIPLYQHYAATWPSRYLGLQGIRGGRQKMPYMELIARARREQCCVHGFAMTRPSVLWFLPFSSVDSTSWMLGARWPDVLWFRPHARQPLPHKVCHKITRKNLVDEGLLHFCRDHGLDAQKLLLLGGCKYPGGREASELRVLAALIAFREYEKFITQYWAARGII
jgi:hypothetical protein